MIWLLDEEDRKEQEREKKLKDLQNEEEIKKLDEKFGIERALACTKINKMAKKHRKDEQSLANKLGLLNSSHYL